MAVDVLIHFAIECMGALTLRCLMGMCRHQHGPLFRVGRVVLWMLFALMTSTALVYLVG
jgi:hypothetical protein